MFPKGGGGENGGGSICLSFIWKVPITRNKREQPWERKNHHHEWRIQGKGESRPRSEYAGSLTLILATKLSIGKKGVYRLTNIRKTKALSSWGGTRISDKYILDKRWW